MGNMDAEYTQKQKPEATFLTPHCHSYYFFFKDITDKETETLVSYGFLIAAFI